MTTYNETRDSEQLRYLKVDIARFILRYGSKPLTRKRRTLFLFPGGMGSQLLRATTPYQDNGTRQTFQYDNYWLSPFTFLGGALFLGMHKHGSDFRDRDNKIVIPCGAVNWFGLTPYTRFTQWCELNDLDWFVFGWDWRRRLDDTVEFFLHKFLPLFRNTVQQQCGADPLRDFILVGHSFAGMVVKLMLHRPGSALANMTRAVTVASPYYGYDGQIHRWFEGEPLLNQIGPIDVTTQMIKVITSLPGGYVLPYLDYQTWQTNRNALQSDPNYPLNNYPSTDFSNAGQDVDPFNPGPSRYPTDTRFDFAELNHAETTYKKIAATPPATYANRFFNIRGIQSPTGSTPGSITWRALTGPLNPHASPVASGSAGPGDGTLPAWSTRLATLNESQVFPVLGNIDHMFIMEDDLTQAAIARALRRRRSMKNKPLPSPAPVPPATRAQVDAFLKGLQEFRAKGEPTLDEAEIKKYDEAAVKAYLDKMSVGSRQRIARRIMMDVLKSPTKDLPGDKSEGTRKPPKKKSTKNTSAQERSRRGSKKKRTPVKKKAANKRR